MTNAENNKKNRAIAMLYRSGAGVLRAIADLLEAEIEDAREEMEGATEIDTIWRAQGRAAACRNLRSAITPRDAE